MQDLMHDSMHWQVDTSRYSGDMGFIDKNDPEVLAEPYTYQKKLHIAVTDLFLHPPDGTFVYISSQHRRIGKTKTLEYFIDGQYAIKADGVNAQSDKKEITKKLIPCEQGETVFQKRHTLCLNLESDDKRLNKKDLYTNIEKYTDGGLADVPEAGLLYLGVGNNLLKCSQGQVGESLSASRVNCYEIVGIGDRFIDACGEPRYRDYDIVVDQSMQEKMMAKSKAKFEMADASKKAQEMGLDTSVFIFFATFDAFKPRPLRDPTLMSGKDMSLALQDKHECFKGLVTGKTQQFEHAKFTLWLKEHGELLTPEGIHPAKYHLNGGQLGEMTIENRCPSGQQKYNLKLK